MAGPLDPGHLFGHVEDAVYFVVPHWFPGADAHGRLYLPQPLNIRSPATSTAALFIVHLPVREGVMLQLQAVSSLKMHADHVRQV